VLDDLGTRVPLPAEAEILSSPHSQSGSVSAEEDTGTCS